MMEMTMDTVAGKLTSYHFARQERVDITDLDVIPTVHSPSTRLTMLIVFRARASTTLWTKSIIFSRHTKTVKALTLMEEAVEMETQKMVAETELVMAA